MFGPGVEHGVTSEVDVAHIVAEDVNGIRKGNTQILQDALEPYSFTCDDCRNSVFSFRARQCNCQLLLATPGNRGAPKLKRKTRCIPMIIEISDPINICVAD